MVMSRAILLKAGGFDTRLRRLEDLDLFIRFAQAGGILETVSSAGVIVRRGYNGKIAPVEQAAALLTEKYIAAGPRQLAPDAQRRLRSWLAVERAVAARNEGQNLRMLRLLATSFALACNAAISAGASSGTRTSGVLPGTGPGTIRVLKKIPASA